jgi:signal transduction histidine kinase/DNA-binding NarL/FixJ family response regulator
VVDVNEAAVRLHEARGKDELLAGLARTFTDESFAVFREELLRLWQGETAMVRDAVVRTLGGERRHVTVQFSVCSDYEETLGKVVVSLNDITERKRAEEELKQHRQHLEQLVDVRTRELAETRDAAESANRMKSIFLANMSHELRTPLNAILGFAHILERDPRLADDQRHKLATIGRSGHHLLSLINDVLEISRIEAGRISVQPSAFDLPAMLDSLRDFVELRAQAKGLELGLELAVSLPRYVRADAGKLRQILVNLLTNAVKYTEAGRIVLSASMRVEAGRTWLDFSVRDTGVGIAPAELESIFQPFHQTAYGAAVGEGTGLGLTISRQYAQLLGGQLTAESRLGAGSVFRLSLPAELAASPAPIPVTHGPVVGLVADQPRYRVLVVDDDADSRYLLEELLRQVEFQVRSAANGEEAVAAFQNWHPHFIWMDMRMPVMDGYEATRRIRAMPAGDQVRIAALTASAFLEDRAGMVAAGCDVVLAKPLDEIQLFATMEGLLGLRFRYADEEPDAGQGEADWDLSALPASLRAELATAARCLDAEAVAQVLVRIRELDARSAAGLQELIKDYRYDRVVSLCDENSVRQPT